MQRGGHFLYKSFSGQLVMLLRQLFVRSFLYHFNMPGFVIGSVLCCSSIMLQVYGFA